MNIVSAFSEENVGRLTGVSKRQLRYWDRTGFFTPAFPSEDRRVPFSRVYSFKDVLSLRTLNVLRNQYSVPLQHLRKVAEKLAHLSDAKWTATTLYVLSKKVVFVEPGTKALQEIVSGQYVIGIPLKTVVSDTRKDVEKLQKREESDVGKVERRRNVARNHPVMAGTRIPVSAVQRMAEDGLTARQIVAEYPSLTLDDVKAALLYRPEPRAA